VSERKQRIAELVEAIGVDEDTAIFILDLEDGTIEGDIVMEGEEPPGAREALGLDRSVTD
jgi:hypothetical protein